MSLQTALLILALLCASRKQEVRFEEQIRALNDDSIAAREEAVGELVKLGEVARDPIRKELKKDPPAEVRARLEDVLRRLDVEKRRKEFKGGNVVNGLCGRLTVEKDKETAAVVLTVEIMNVGDGSKDLVLIKGWSTSVPGYSYSGSTNHAGVSVERLSKDDREEEGSVGMRGCTYVSG